MSNLYEVLNVAPDSTIEQIKSAYKKLALRLHPDKNPSPDAKEKFQKVSEAYQILSNPEKRKKYDDYGIIDEEDIDTNMYDMHFEDFMDQFFGSVVDPFMQMFFEGLNPEEDFFQEIENLNPGKKGKNKKNTNAKKSKKSNPKQESPFDLFEEIFKNEDYDDSWNTESESDSSSDLWDYKPSLVEEQLFMKEIALNQFIEEQITKQYDQKKKLQLYVCQICGKKTKSKDENEEHIALQHQVQFQEWAGLSEPNKKSKKRKNRHKKKNLKE